MDRSCNLSGITVGAGGEGSGSDVSSDPSSNVASWLITEEMTTTSDGLGGATVVGLATKDESSSIGWRNSTS